MPRVRGRRRSNCRHWRRIHAAPLLAVPVVGCDRGAAETSPSATPGDTAPPAGCWIEVLPLGSGGFPASPGSNDEPKWQPGKIPVTLPLRVAF